MVNAKRSRGGIAPRERLRGRDIRVKSQFRIETDDFLISKRQIIHGACGVVPKELAGSIVSNEYVALRPKPSLDIGYLRHLSFTPYFQRTCFHSSVGVDVEKMVFKLEQWLRYFVPIPPLPEQRKIASILSTVDDTIGKTQSVIDQMDVVKKGLLSVLLTQGMPGRHKKFKETELGSIPTEWALRPAAELCERIVVGIVVQPAKHYVNSGIPCLRSKNIREDRIELSDLVFLSPESNQLHAKSIIRAGDVLTVRTGYPGTSSVAPPELDGANCVDLIISTPKPSLRGAFMSRFINSPAGMQQIALGQGGLAQQHFNVGAMKSLLIPVPSIAEQDEILERLGTVDDTLSHNRAVHTQLGTMKAGLLDLLLSGRRRVSTANQEAA